MPSPALQQRLQYADVPLLRLPNEVLDDIASILVDNWPLVSHRSIDGVERSTPSIGWIAVTHVCRALRVALLGHRELWARTAHNFCGEAYSEICSRAGDLPLSFIFPSGVSCSHLASRVQTMLENRARAKHPH
jgi:hypothetical protein